MKQIVTHGIVLSRTDFGEADRILNFLTPDHGKIAGIAKGVRKSKSKLAGGIELFSVSELSFIVGKSDIYTITSARLVKHYSNIVKDLDRTNTGYEFIRLLNKATEDNPEPAYFHLLQNAFDGLDKFGVEAPITNLWFSMRLIKLAGHAPNLYTDKSGEKLDSSKKYMFDFDHMQFAEDEQGIYDANLIKFLRLGFAADSPGLLQKIQNTNKIINKSTPLVNTLLQNFIRI